MLLQKSVALPVPEIIGVSTETTGQEELSGSGVIVSADKQTDTQTNTTENNTTFAA